MPNQKDSDESQQKKKLKIRKNNKTSEGKNIEQLSKTRLQSNEKPDSTKKFEKKENPNRDSRVNKNKTNNRDIKNKKNKNTNSEPKKRIKLKSKPKEKPVEKGPYTEALAEVLAKKKPVDERLIGINFESNDSIPQPTAMEEIVQRDERIYYLTGKGKAHPVHEIQNKLRDILIHSGFNELENQYFVPEKDIFEQYGIKSGLVFEETYYLGETQRVKFEIKPEQLSKFEEIFLHINFDSNKFINLFKEYDDNAINITQFFQKLKDDLDFSNIDLYHMIDEIPELKSSNPRLTSITLRSKMDSPWLSTLKAIMDEDNLPLKVFSTGMWFKREPKQSELLAKAHYGASCIIMDNDINLETGQILVEELLERIDIGELEFKTKKEINEIKINQKELEVYSKDIKIATCGMFSKRVLKKFDFEIPILYINFGLEHLVMVKEGMDDIHELMYPQFHSAWMLNDQDIAKAIQYIQIPKTEVGNEITENLYNICLKNNNAPSPCEFIVWDGVVQIGLIKKENIIDSEAVMFTNTSELTKAGKRLIVKVIKKEKGGKLCGPATLNEIVVKNGDIFGIQNPDQNPEFSSSVRTEFNYLKAFSNFVGRQIELEVENGNLDDISVINAGIIKDMEDINLQLDGRAIRYISSNNKKIDVKGPMFVDVEYSFKRTDEKKDQDDTPPEDKKI